MKRITEVNSKRELGEFIDFPHELYKSDPNYVPELFIAQRDLLSPGKHPFHKHSKIRLFLVYDNNRITGRIAAILNNNHNAFNNSNDGFFGFFDCINDQATADILLGAARNWLAGQKVDMVIGPVNFSTNEACGLLIDGFDSPPVAMMTYNAPYYQTLLENAGFTKKVDLYAYQIIYGQHNDKSFRMLNVLEERLKRNDITIRKVNVKNFKEETAKLREVYNSAWDKNLGFVPMTEEEFNYLAKDLKMILRPEFCLVAEQKGKLVGFVLGIPDINQIQIKIKRGRLLPTGLFKLLTGLKKIDGLRILCLGVVDGYRKMGIEAALYGYLIKNAENANIKTVECSWMLEHNYLMNHAIEQINGVHYKTYRIFEQPI